MTLDLDRYRVNIPFFITHMSRIHDNEARVNAVSEFSVATGVPVLACFYYYTELFGSTSDVQKRIESLTSFYKITQVAGLKA